MYYQSHAKRREELKHLTNKEIEVELALVRAEIDRRIGTATPHAVWSRLGV